MQFSDQKKGMLMAFTAVMFLTPDSLFIRLANVNSWNLIFYRGFIPFSLVFIGLLIIYKNNLIKKVLSTGWYGISYAFAFSVTNITFVISMMPMIPVVPVIPVIPLMLRFPRFL